MGACGARVLRGRQREAASPGKSTRQTRSGKRTALPLRRARLCYPLQPILRARWESGICGALGMLAGLRREPQAAVACLPGLGGGARNCNWKAGAKQVCGKGRIGSAASTPLEAAARALRKQRRARPAASVCIRRAQQGVRGAACPRGAAKRPGGQFPPTSTQKIKASLRLAPLGGELCERTRYLSVATL